MPKLNIHETQRPHALLVAPHGGGKAEVAAFSTASGDTVYSNADIKPYSPVDGAPMQVLSSKHKFITADKMSSMVKVAHCAACDNDLLATASLADAIEVSGGHIHCPFCSSEVTASINTRQLITALAEEMDDDVMDDAPAEDEEPVDDTEAEDDSEPEDDAEGDGEETAEEDGGDEAESDFDVEGDEDPDEDADPDDDGDVDDDGAAEDTDDDAADLEDEDETAKVVARLRRTNKGPKPKKAKANEDCDTEDMGDESGNDEDGEDADDAEFASVVRALRKKVLAMGLDEDEPVDDEPVDDTEGDESDDADIVADEGEPEGDESEMDDEVEAAAAKLAKRIKTTAHRPGDRPTAGKPVDNDAIANMNDQARAALRARQGNKPDGNANLKAAHALAGDDNVEGDVTTGEDGKTPGTNVKEGVTNKQVETPGSNRAPVKDSDTQEVTPGTSETSGDLIVDWKSAKIALVATDDSTRWVFANGMPVAQLFKSKASAGVAAQWSNDSAIAKTFSALCARGLPLAEASEFGYAPHKFAVKAEDVMRNAMHRQADLATANAQKEIVRGIDRYKQSVRSALLAALKGVYPDQPNPMRDALIQSLNKISVTEPRSVVDTALAGSVEPFIVSVFKKADEIANKPDEARNEIANFVASASYQARIDEGSMLAAQLANNSAKVVTAGIQSARDALVEKAEKDANANDQGTLVRRALHSLRR